MLDDRFENILDKILSNVEKLSLASVAGELFDCLGNYKYELCEGNNCPFADKCIELVKLRKEHEKHEMQEKAKNKNFMVKNFGVNKYICSFCGNEGFFYVCHRCKFNSEDCANIENGSCFELFVSCNTCRYYELNRSTEEPCKSCFNQCNFCSGFNLSVWECVEDVENRIESEKQEYFNLEE
jgi:hypothetical protein